MKRMVSGVVLEIMKDLKDFFGKAVAKKPKEDEEFSPEPERKRRRKSAKIPEEIEEIPPAKKKSKKKLEAALNGISVDCDSDQRSNKKKKRQSKRKIGQDEMSTSSQSAVDVSHLVDICDDSSRSSGEQEVVVKISKKKRKVSLEKMSPDVSEEVVEYSPPSANNSLLKYFNKVDKSEVLLTPKVERSLLKVKAMVHDPPPKDPEEKKKRSPKFEDIKIKLRLSLSGNKDKKKKKADKVEDYDVIVCETIEEPVVGCRVGGPGVGDVSQSLEGSSPQTVNLVDEDSNSTPDFKRASKLPVKMKPNGTLASFFTIGNRVPKPITSLSEEQKQAKQNFLLSGSPANIKKIVAASGSNACGTPAPLPKVSHVRQKDPMHIIWNLSNVELKLKRVDVEVMLPSWSSITQAHQVPPVNGIHGVSGDPLKFDQKKELKQLKREAGGLPVSVWFKDLREMKKNGEGLIWSEKYKPKSIVHLSLCNLHNVEKLQNWLVTMRDNTKKEESEAYNSEDDFIVDDGSCDSRVSRFKRAALITGPCGIGKTSIVYAVARELGYQILELNASANRSGKKILQEFSEALQSHKVEANCTADLIGKKGSKKKKDIPKLPKHSLILVEDADLVFSDNDDGFLSTAATLAASSKRPVVFIANEKGCKHLLSKIATHLEINLHFSTLRHERINTWLRTVSIAENMNISSHEANLLISWAKQLDIRRCLLQLEFLRAGNSTVANGLSSDIRTSSSIWHKLGNSDVSPSSSQTGLLRHCLNLLAVADVLLTTIKTQLKYDNPCRRYWESDGRDSTELGCPTGESSNLLTEEISAYSLSLMDSILEGETTYCYNVKKQEDWLFGNMEQCLVSPTSLLNRSAVALDISPTLREISRSEQTRFANQTKRNNRYFHYLRPDDTRTSHKMDFELYSKPFSPTNITETPIDFDLTIT